MPSLLWLCFFKTDPDLGGCGGEAGVAMVYLGCDPRKHGGEGRQGRKGERKTSNDELFLHCGELEFTLIVDPQGLGSDTPQWSHHEIMKMGIFFFS